MQSVTSARAGRIQSEGDDRFLVLRSGQRFEKDMETGGIKLSDFEEYSVLVDERTRDLARAELPRALSTAALLAGGTPTLLGELSWRLGLALAACNLVLAGLVVSVVNPRVGRNGNWYISAEGTRLRVESGEELAALRGAVDLVRDGESRHDADGEPQDALHVSLLERSGPTDVHSTAHAHSTSL